MDERINKFCKQPLPREEVSKREGPGKVMLDYVSGYYATTQLNSCFGHAGWSFKRVECTTDVYETKGKFQAHCVYHGSLLANGSQIDDVGVGHGFGYKPGDAIESAIKEARTDCLKRCAKDLGPVFGLALYDKQQREVADVDSETLIKQSQTVTTKADLERWSATVKKAVPKLNSEELKELKSIKDELQKKELV